VVINQELRFTGNEAPKEEDGNESDADPLLPNKKKKASAEDGTKKFKILRKSSRAKTVGTAAANITGMAVSWLRKAAGRGSGLGTL